MNGVDMNNTRWMRVLLLLAAVFFSANAMAGAPSESERLMAGTWYGEFAPTPKKAVQRFVTTRNADGSFTLHARLYEDGKVVSDLRNRGLWGISNGIYFTVTTEVNGQKTEPRHPEVINAYLVQSLGADVFEYVHVASGNRFRVMRVDPATAKLPD
jgi:hypothetical protein